MSRIGKKPIAFSTQTKIEIKDDAIFVEGKKGKLSLKIPYGIEVSKEDNQIVVKRKSEDKNIRSLHGTIRALTANMVKGVEEGFKKELEIVGVGYKAQVKGNTLVLDIGFSHPVKVNVPEGVKVQTPAATKIVVEGIDKQKVGQFAAKLRDFYPPEPYKGKGIRYSGEFVRKKLGKAMAK